MSPRERAEALGWERRGSTWYARLGNLWGPRTTALTMVWLESVRPEVWRTRDCPSPGALTHRHRTEDEALEHALLLLDVWLS